MPICQFCLHEKVLQKSHIVPEFLYQNIYNTDHQMIGINGQGPLGRAVLQKGLYERLLCEPCEQYFNKHFEKPFYRHWFTSPSLPSNLKIGDIHWITVHYNSFKLFHLSVLFRASVSTLPMFSSVKLGDHETRLRRVLFDKSPGDSTQYPILGCAIVHHETNQCVPIVTRPEVVKIGAARAYGMVYGGVKWWVGISSHPIKELEKGSLQSDGHMPILVSSWKDEPAIQAMSVALNQRPKLG
jgi:hypothetical protein